jgi:hypothetical protein
MRDANLMALFEASGYPHCVMAIKEQLDAASYPTVPNGKSAAKSEPPRQLLYETWRNSAGGMR